MGFTDLFKQAKRVLGGIYQVADPLLVDGQPAALRTDDKANLKVTLGASGAIQEVDIKKVDGKAVLDGGPDGSQSVGGTAGHGVDSTQNPMLGAAIATAADPVAVGEGKLVQDSANLTGYRRIMNDLFRVAGQAIAGAGLAGVLPVAGTGADGSAPTASYPSRFAGIVRKILTPLTDTHQQTILVDGDGALWGRSKAFDSISSADRGAVNTAADVHDNDGAPGVQASEANVGASTVSYPSSSGIALGDYTGLDHEIVATDCTFIFLHSLTGGAGTWIPITTCVQDNSFSGMSGFAVFATGVGLSRNFDLTTSGHKGGFLRCDVTYPDGGNAFAWKTAGRYGA